MTLLAGMKVTRNDGMHAVVIKPGATTKVLSLASGEYRDWGLDSFHRDEKQDVVSVFVVNPPTGKATTIMLGGRPWEPHHGRYRGHPICHQPVTEWNRSYRFGGAGVWGESLIGAGVNV